MRFRIKYSMNCATVELMRLLMNNVHVAVVVDMKVCKDSASIVSVQASAVGISL